MRMLGTISERNDVTTTVPMLTQVGLLQPAIMPNVLNLFESNYSSFSSFLNRKNLTRTGLYSGLESDTFKVIGNRQVKWSVEGYPTRKATIVEAPTNAVNPGLGNSEFSFVTDIDWFGINDDLELEDRRTTLHVMAKQRVSGGTRYFVKLNTNSTTNFCDPTLVAVDKEVGWLHTSYPEGSEDATEKHVFPEWYTNFIGIQRAKYTISGSAHHSKVMVEHQGTKMWDTVQNMRMMARWAMGVENQMLWARSTMDANGNCYLKDREGRDIVMGDGLVAQGDASLKYEYNTLTARTLENIMQDMQALQNNQGMLELALICGSQFYFEFQRVMRDVFPQGPQVLYVGGNGSEGSGIRTHFSWFQMADVRINIIHAKSLDDPTRPIARDIMGRPIMSSSAYFVSLGNTVGGEPNVEMLTLGNEHGDRQFVRRVISGMAGPGVSVSNSGKYSIQAAASPVDGMQVHVLNETGLVLRNMYGFAELRKARRA